MTLYIVGAVALAIIAGLWVFGLRLRQAGENKVRAEVAVKTVDVQAAQQKAAVNAPEGKTAIIDRLRNGGGL